MKGLLRWNNNKNEIPIVKNFSSKLLNNLKKYAIILSEDFPNFVRVDLYVFHENIYFSELTFDANEGIPVFKKYKVIQEAGKHWRRIDWNNLFISQKEHLLIDDIVNSI